MAANVQEILKILWPFPICDEGEEDLECTSFPLPVPARDDDGGLSYGRCLVYNDDGSQFEVDCDELDSPVDMNFLQPNKDEETGTETTNGVIDYLCTWTTLHTLSFNGDLVLT